MTYDPKLRYCTHGRDIGGIASPGQYHCIRESQHGDWEHFYRVTDYDVDKIDEFAKKAAIYDAEQEFTQACKDAADGKRGPLTWEEIDRFRLRGVSMAPAPRVKKVSQVRR